MKRNLIICPIGDGSVHQTWLAQPELAEFDLFLIYYGSGEDWARADATYYGRRKGFKFELLHFAATEYREVLSQYELIWCPDDDIAISTTELNSLFEIVERYELQLAQPSIARGDASYRNLIQRPGNILRYTPFVEVMCPVFTRGAFFKVSDTFSESRSGWGLDWVWAKQFSLHEMAVIDKVGVHHTRPLCSGEHYKNLARLGIDPARDLAQVTARHGGIDSDLVERMRRGRMPMQCVIDDEDGRSVVGRIRDQVAWRFRKRRAA
jgi:hypothetical protein